MPPLNSDWDRLGSSTQAQYRRVLRWMEAEYGGTWDRTEPIQEFIDRHPDARVRHGLFGRVIQSIVNRYIDPIPKGPVIRLPPRKTTATDDDTGGEAGRRTKRSRTKSAGDTEEDTDAWLAYVPVYLRPWARAHGRWSEWIHRFVVTLGANATSKYLVRAYVTHVHHVLFRELGCETPEDLGRLERTALARAVAEVNRGRPPQQRMARVALNRFLADVCFADHGPIFAQRLRLRRRDITVASVGATGVRGGGHPSDLALGADAVAARVRGRDHFTEAEIHALLRLRNPVLSVRDQLILRVLAETGLRRRAVSWLLVEDRKHARRHAGERASVGNVYDRVADAPLPVAAATEKGMVTRRFALSRGARALLAEYVRDAHPGPTTSRWLFPSPRQPRHPITPVVINHVLQRACRKVGIAGRFTHSHAVRKFVVVRLMQEDDNRIEDVSKWIGHKTVDLIGRASHTKRARFRRTVRTGTLRSGTSCPS